MTTPAPSGGSSPLRIGGLALVGVGAVAALIGVASLIGGGGGATGTANTAAAPTSVVEPTPAAAAPVAPTTAPVATTAPAGSVAVPSFGSTTAPATSAPSTGAGGTASTPRAVTKSPVRVYNNGTIKGLANKAADEFRAQGWPVESIANYSQGVIATSTVYYRTGTGEQASADAFARTFGMRAEPRFNGLNDASPGLIVIVTNDYRGH